MILLIQNNSLYEADLRAMLQAFFPATRIATATPEEAGTLSTKMFREMDFCLTALFAEKYHCPSGTLMIGFCLM